MLKPEQSASNSITADSPPKPQEIPDKANSMAI